MTQLDAVIVVPAAASVPASSVAPARVAVLAKAALDRVAAAVLLAVSMPFLAMLVIAVRSTSPGPALFTQPRIGRDGELFRIVKLRTMVHGAEAELADGGPKVPGDPRITGLGRVLRRWSLDELPNLWNVLRGDMSLVGPRPDVPGGVLASAGPDAARRHDVRPGLTGLWQVSGRSDLDLDSRVRLDVDYVQRWSLGLDLRILARTLAAVVRGTGAY
jgi:lipopolysaccharide/colanic/teichoic acid biosynthesis glycosyltransferase